MLKCFYKTIFFIFESTQFNFIITEQPLTLFIFSVNTHTYVYRQAGTFQNGLKKEPTLNLYKFKDRESLIIPT